MDDAQTTNKKEKKLMILISVVLVLIIAVIIVFFVLSNQENNIDDNDKVITYADEFYNISPDDAYQLMNLSEKIEVIDVRGLEGCSHCQFNNGHLPGAELNQNPESFYMEEGDYENATDFLVYSKDGSVGAEFCLELVDYVYGSIYNLEGGWEAWAAKGYPMG